MNEINSSIIKNKQLYNSFYDNNLKNSVSHHIKSIFLGIITLGLAYPWILCMKYDARCKHTVICGKRLKFIGNPKELILHWILWWFLTIITFGIYKIVVNIRIDQWITANTIFEEIEQNNQN